MRTVEIFKKDSVPWSKLKPSRIRDRNYRNSTLKNMQKQTQPKIRINKTIFAGACI